MLCPIFPLCYSLLWFCSRKIRHTLTARLTTSKQKLQVQHDQFQSSFYNLIGPGENIYSLNLRETSVSMI